MIGFMANNVLPLRLGEFIRPWALARRERLSKTTLFATVVVERAIDMVTLLVIFGISVLVHPISSATEAGRVTQAGATVLVTACAGLTVFVIALERSEKLARAVIDRLSAPFPPSLRGRAVRALEHFVKGLGLFRDLPRVLWVFALSFGMFGVIVIGLAAGMWALGIVVPWYAGLVMLVITAIGIMVPAAPGYIGTMNLACIAGLAIFGVGKEPAVPAMFALALSPFLAAAPAALIVLSGVPVALAARAVAAATALLALLDGLRPSAPAASDVDDRPAWIAATLFTALVLGLLAGNP